MLAYAGKDALAHGSCDDNLSWIVIKDEAQLGEQLVGLRDMRKPLTIAIEIIVNHSRIRFLVLDDMRQQTTATAEIYIGGSVGKLL